MGLSQLLAVGRSVRTIKDGPARYKMTQQNLLPKFGGERAAEARATEIVSPRAEAVPVSAQSEPSAASATETEEGCDEGDPGPGKAALFVEATKKLRPFSGWSLFRNPFGQFLAREARSGPWQTELLLGSVKPMRNDLSDSSFEGDGRCLAAPQPDARPGPMAGPSPIPAAPRRGPWQRLKTRWFGASDAS